MTKIPNNRDFGLSGQISVGQDDKLGRLQLNLDKMPGIFLVLQDMDLAMAAVAISEARSFGVYVSVNANIFLIIISQRAVINNKYFLIIQYSGK
jgi:hypothetical protein